MVYTIDLIPLFSHTYEKNAKIIAKIVVYYTLGQYYFFFMTPYLIVTCIILITLILIQVRDGGLNVTTSSTLQAPVEKR